MTAHSLNASRIMQKYILSRRESRLVFVSAVYFCQRRFVNLFPLKHKPNRASHRNHASQSERISNGSPSTRHANGITTSGVVEQMASTNPVGVVFERPLKKTYTERLAKHTVGNHPRPDSHPLFRCRHDLSHRFVELRCHKPSLYNQQRRQARQRSIRR